VWVNLPHVGGAFSQYDDQAPVSQLTPVDVDSLMFPTTASLVVVSEKAQDLATARLTLRSRGIRADPMGSGAWEGRLYYQVLQVRRLAPGDAERAARLVAQAYLDASSRRDATALCRLIAPTAAVALAVRTATTTCPEIVRVPPCAGGEPPYSAPARQASIATQHAHRSRARAGSLFCIAGSRYGVFRRKAGEDTTIVLSHRRQVFETRRARAARDHIPYGFVG
jgi:hypothetical protein